MYSDFTTRKKIKKKFFNLTNNFLDRKVSKTLVLKMKPLQTI